MAGTLGGAPEISGLTILGDSKALLEPVQVNPVQLNPNVNLAALSPELLESFYG